MSMIIVIISVVEKNGCGYIRIIHQNMDVSANSGTPKSSFAIGFSIINHPFWGTSIFENTHIISQFETKRKRSQFLHKGGPFLETKRSKNQ